MWGPGRPSGCPGCGRDRIGKARYRKPMMYGPKESDTGIVAEKPANKAVRAAAELAEPRPVTNGNSRGQRTDRTQCRGTVYQAAERIRRSSGPRSLPEVGAVCVSAHVRICAGGAGQPASLPRRTADECAGPSATPGGHRNRKESPFCNPRSPAETERGSAAMNPGTPADSGRRVATAGARTSQVCACMGVRTMSGGSVGS